MVKYGYTALLPEDYGAVILVLSVLFSNLIKGLENLKSPLSSIYLWKLLNMTKSGDGTIPVLGKLQVRSLKIIDLKIFRVSLCRRKL